MGDDSERTDPASGAGTSDGESSEGDESGSDVAAETDADTERDTDTERDAGTATDADTAASTASPPDRSADESTAAAGDDAVEGSEAVADADDSDTDGTDDASTDEANDADDSDTDDADNSDTDDADDSDTDGADNADTVDADDSDADIVDDADSGTVTESPDDDAGDTGPDGADESDDTGADAADSGESDDPAAGDSDDIWPGNGGPPADAAEVAGTDGGAPAAPADAATGTGGSAESLVDDEFVSEGPESDEEMPLADHIEEMIHRLAVVIGVGGVVTLLLYPGADLVNSAFGLDLVSSTEVIDFLWNKHVPGAPELTDRRPRVYGPLELLLTELKVAALGGLVIALPVFVYETYLFMRPGLYPKERRYYLAAVPTSIVLAFVGIAFAHFVVLPAIFAYFTSYTTGTAVVAFGLKETFNLILILMGYNAIIFQIPLFIMLAIMMNLVTRTWLEDRRLLFWGAFLGLAFLVSPDPTGMAPIIIGATMIVLFEGTLLALRWTRSGDGAAA